MRIARELLVMHMEGQNRIRAVKQYAEEYGVGTGTVQGAFQALKSAGAIELNACGASGTFMTNVNRRRLFDACGYGELICLMPLDANLPMRALATGIYKAVSDQKLPIHILFARGSRNRLKMVKREKADFTVMSRHAYEAAVRLGEETVEVVGSAGVYPGKMGYITRRGTALSRADTPVAFDRYSYDQLALHTDLHLLRHTRQDWLNVQLADQVRSGEVRAALGRFFDEEEDLCFHPLEGVSPETQRKLSDAVLVARKGEDSLVQLLKRTATYEKVSAIQNEVITGKRMVEY